MSLTIAQINSVLPAVSPPTPAEAPIGATPLLAHTVSDGIATSHNNPAATKGGQLPNFYQIISLLNSTISLLSQAIDSGDTATLAAGNTAIATMVATITGQLALKANQIDLQAVQTQLQAAQLGYKHLNLDVLTIADTALNLAQPIASTTLIGGTALQSGTTILVNAQNGSTPDPANGFYDVTVGATAGTFTLTRNNSPLPAGTSVIIAGASSNYAGAIAVLQGTQFTNLGDPCLFTVYSRYGQVTGDGVAIKQNGSQLYFDVGAADTLLLAQEGRKPAQRYVAGDGSKTQLTITHNQGSTEFWCCTVKVGSQISSVLPVVVDANNIQVNFSSPPATGSVVVILGALVGATTATSNALVDSNGNTLLDSIGQVIITS